MQHKCRCFWLAVGQNSTVIAATVTTSLVTRANSVAIHMVMLCSESRLPALWRLPRQKFGQRQPVDASSSITTEDNCCTMYHTLLDESKQRSKFKEHKRTNHEIKIHRLLLMGLSTRLSIFNRTVFEIVNNASSKSLCNILLPYDACISHRVASTYLSLPELLPDCREFQHGNSQFPNQCQ